MSQMPMCAVKRLEYFKITLNLASGLLFWKDWSLCMLKAVSIEWKAHTERESCGSLEYQPKWKKLVHFRSKTFNWQISNSETAIN